MTTDSTQQDNSPEIEEMKQQLEGGLQDKPSPTDYRIRKKKIWNGKVAPNGCMFIVVDFDKNKSHYVNAMMIQGTPTEDEVSEIAEVLREGIRKKFNV